MQESNIKFRSIVNVGIWSTMLLDLDIPPLIDRLYEIKSTTPSVYRSNKGGYQTDSILQHDITFSPLLTSILKVYEQIFLTSDVKIDDMWGNISSFGDYNSMHLHYRESHRISGVIYLKVPKNSGNFEFLSPVELNLVGYHFPKVKELILFPSYLMHAVAPNLSQEDRISIAFNFN